MNFNWRIYLLLVATLVVRTQTLPALSTGTGCNKVPTFLNQKLWDQNSESQEEDSLIAKINSKQSSWTAGHTGITLEQLEIMSGTIIDDEHFASIPVIKHKLTEQIPEEYDSRKVWSNCTSIGLIRNQGPCGSCWAFAATGVISDRICTATKVDVQISAEDLACCFDCIPYGDFCLGGSVELSFDYYANYGLVTGGNYNSGVGCKPYQVDPNEASQSVQCDYSCSNSNYIKSYEEDKFYGMSSFYRIIGVEQIQMDILKYGSVAAIFSVYPSIRTYCGGVYQILPDEVDLPKNRLHAVRVIGWGVENDIPYWLVANSWGEDWGIRGFFKILRGNNECGFEANILAAHPRL